MINLILISFILLSEALNAKSGKLNVEVLPIIIFIVLVVLMFFELFFLKFWVKPYFKYGIIVLKKTFNLPANFDVDLKDFVDVELLGDSIHHPLKIKKLDNYNFALRVSIGSRFLRLTYPSLMRGLITIDFNNNKIILKGFLYYQIIPGLSFFIILLNNASFDVSVMFIYLLLFLMLFWSYSAQKNRFNSLIKLLITKPPS